MAYSAPANPGNASPADPIQTSDSRPRSSATRPVGRHCDGNGLYLVVQPTGTRSWIQRIAIRGRRRDIGLGSVRLVPLAEAREKALVNRKLARDGGDPLADRRRAKRIPLFAAAAEKRLEPAAARLAQSQACPRLVAQLRELRLPAHRSTARFRGDGRRPAGDPRAHLAHHAEDRATAAPAHPRRAGVGRGPGASRR